MSTFDPTEHPRTGDGQFSVKARTESGVVLDPPVDGTWTAAALEHAEAVAKILDSGYASDMRDEVGIHFSGRRRGAIDSGDKATLELGPDGVRRWRFHVEDPDRPRGQKRYVETVDSDLTVDTAPEVVAEWLQGQMGAHGTPDDREARAEYRRWDAATKAVAELLPSNGMDDLGDTPSIFFGSREDDTCFGDVAYLRPPGLAEDEPHLDLHWHFQTEDTGQKYPSGFYSDVQVAEHLDINSDPREVAAWIRQQMEAYGTPALRTREL